MKTTKTKPTSFDQFRRNFQKNMKFKMFLMVIIFIFIIWIMIILCAFLAGASRYTIFSLFICAMITIFAYMVLLVLIGKIEYFGFGAKRIIELLQEEIQRQQKRWNSLESLSTFTAAEIEKYCSFMNDNELRSDWHTVKEQIQQCNENITLAQDKIRYVNANSLTIWQYFLSWKWTKKITV